MTIFFLLFLLVHQGAQSFFVAPGTTTARLASSRQYATRQDAEKVINLAKNSISRDSKVKEELGSLLKVENVLGFGSPSSGVVAVSFNASFKRQGTPFFTMGGEKKLNNRGKTVGKVSARFENGRLSSCVIAKDGGWGKSINVNV